MQDAPQEKILRRIVQYVRHWMRWVLSGVTDVPGDDAFNCLVEDPAQYPFGSPTSALTTQSRSA